MEEEKKVICFDANGTIIDEDTWAMFDVEKSEIDGLIDNYEKGKMTIAELWEGMVKIFRRTGQATREFIYGYWKSHCNLREGAEDLIRYLKGKGYKIYLVSCSIEPCLEIITENLGLDGFFAGSHLRFDREEMLEKIDSECTDKFFKVRKVEEIAKREGVSVKDIFFVGDGHNDIGAFELTGRGIAINTKISELLAVSWKRVDSLPEIKEILK